MEKLREAGLRSKERAEPDKKLRGDVWVQGCQDRQAGPSRGGTSVGSARPIVPAGSRAGLDRDKQEAAPHGHSHAMHGNAMHGYA
jgi:hypothetical protein